MKIRFHLFLLAAMCLTLSACDFGEVDQGRCVAYNENTGKFTMILDVNHDQFNPQYTGGAYEYQMPADPKECGPAPKAGGRVHFDIEKKQIKGFLLHLQFAQKFVSVHVSFNVKATLHIVSLDALNNTIKV